MESLGQSSRVWVYQAERQLNAKEIEQINKKLSNFISEWNSHGRKLSAGYEVRHNQFVILAVDESQAGASGCSIDSSVKVITTLESQLKISLLDKSKVAYKLGDEIKTAHFSGLKELVQKGEINEETIIFNNHITYLEELKSNWTVKASKCWVSRYLS